MTETIPAVLTDEIENPNPSSMGLVTSGCLVDIQRPDGSSVEPNEVGEVVVGGEIGINIFNGYLDAPAITKESFRDEWFLTGDRAKRDVDGKFFFDGRRSDVLKVSGENVSIVEVESILSEHPGVLEAAVVGFTKLLIRTCLQLHVCMEWKEASTCEELLYSLSVGPDLFMPVE